MALKRIVDTRFWTDDKVIEQFSPEDKLFMLYLLTNPHTTQLGVYAINKKIMAFEIGYSLDVINVLLDRFENKYQMIKYSKRTNEIAIKNYLKYSIIKGGKPVEDCLEKEIQQVKDKSLLSYIFNNNYTNISINNIINKYNIYNDNEVSYHDTYNDTCNDTQKKETKKAETEEEFEILWKLYPKKNGKKKSYDYYVRAKKKGVTFDTIKLGIEKYVDYIEKTNTPLKYVKDGSTWFNQECWSDERIIDQNQQLLPDWFNQEIEKEEMTDEEKEEMDALLKELLNHGG